MKLKILIFFLLNTILILSGKEINDLINEGITYLKIGDYEKSLKALEEARRASPENSDVYYYLGEIYFRKGEIEKAIPNLQKAIDISPEKPSYYYSLALVYLSQNKNKEAIEMFEKVIKISPLSIYGKEAERLKKEIENKNKEIEIVKRWEKLEIEERKRKEEIEKKQQEKPQEGIFLPGMEPGMEKVEKIEKEKKIPIQTLIKRIKFGTLNKRIDSSKLIIGYSSLEIAQIIEEILDIIEEESEPEIKRNLIIAIGKVNKPEVVDLLLDIIKDEKELFEIRIVALDTIGNLKAEKVIEELRETLSKMVSLKEREREEAKNNIQQINQKIDDLTAERITLNSEIQDLNNKKNQIDNILGASPEGIGPGMPPEMMGPGGFQPTPTLGKTLSEKEVKKLMEEKRKIEDKIKQNNEELEKINKQLGELNEKKKRYEELLAIKERKIDISSLGTSATVIQIQEQIQPGFLPGGPEGPGFIPQPEFRYSQRQTDEEKNEIIFAIKLMNILADMRDKESLSIIKKAWKEFGVPGLKIYYYINLGKLGEYRNIDLMVQRLRENFPSGDIKEEINIRKNIIEVLGDYLRENQDETIKGLIEYIAEESEYPEIKNMAQKVASSFAKVPTE
ncbi:MAG: tetratricopeptide repeat protein [Candidatus Omnitrophica bacterium]|nr:tetratricopeptide repeat protein [Candidatus Omnitrophota bacterium]